MEKYNFPVNEDSIKSDKKHFSLYYGIDLDKYVQGENFIIPYEMADLFCLMMIVMRSSPTYDKRMKIVSLENIINHNKEIINLADKLPSEIANYIEETSEYASALTFINCLPVAVERMAALLHITLERGDPGNIEQLVDDLDELYERYFWNVDLDDVFEADFAKPFRPVTSVEDSNARRLFDNIFADITANFDCSGESIDIEKIDEILGDKYKNEIQNVKTEDILAMLENLYRPTATSETLNAYHIFDYMLANLFKALERENWPDGTEEKVVNLFSAVEREI